VSGIVPKLSVVCMKVGAGSIILEYVDKSIEEVKKSEDLSLKEEAKKKARLKDKNKH
jgi:hypothetical protein